MKSRHVHVVFTHPNTATEIHSFLAELSPVAGGKLTAADMEPLMFPTKRSILEGSHGPRIALDWGHPGGNWSEKAIKSTLNELSSGK